ncbi:DUF2933 domain-containing protein [Candidatus Hakubella thermalkaliphila]|nr:DUF2933 domain-containing protein [Candidatus Hakubella thermalkaliphila]
MSNKHLVFMILCCLIPVALFVGLLVFGIPMSSLIFFALILLCPLAHIFLMRGMGHGGHHEPAPEPAKRETDVNRPDAL